eukprot:TRINITY_DN8277_c0_g1_i1.p1 TRINITY_DN8277_c0_g1~~TRINITY_DN8277_c0_g1_i1.p1  ORF type:complete len:678 (+),score=159.91 TRINITY_DN8277_c0_g1_i1:67-2100(+)
MQSVIRWVKSLEGLSKECTSVTDLADGVLFAEILGEISPTYFNISQMKDCRGNWVLKAGNLKRLTKPLERFYLERMGCKIDVAAEVDINAISRSDLEPEVLKLASLCLTCLFGSENRAEFIEKIRALPEEDQHQIMELMQSTLARHNISFDDIHPGAAEPGHGADVDDSLEGSLSSSQPQAEGAQEGDEDDYFTSPSLKRIDLGPGKHMASLQTALQSQMQSQSNAQEMERLQATLQSREQEMQSLSERNEALQQENSKLSARLTELLDKRITGSVDQESSESASSGAAEVIASLRTELEARDRTVAELNRRVQELQKKAEKAESLQDEVDILQTKAKQVDKLEKQLEAFKKKAEEAAGLRQQLQLQEEQNEKCLDKALELERGLEAKTRELQRAQEQLADANKALDRVRQDVEGSAGANLKLADLEREIGLLREREGRHQARIQELTEQLEDRQAEGFAVPALPASGEDLDDIHTKLQQKENMKRLEKENEYLKTEVERLSKASTVAPVVPAPAEVDTAAFERRELELRRELADTKDKYAALEKELAEVRATPAPLAASESAAEPGQSGDPAVLKRATEAEEKCEQLRRRLQEQERVHSQNLKEFEQRWQEAKNASQLEQKLIVSAFFDAGMQNFLLQSRLAQQKDPHPSRTWLGQQRQKQRQTAAAGSAGAAPPS